VTGLSPAVFYCNVYLGDCSHCINSLSLPMHYVGQVYRLRCSVLDKPINTVCVGKSIINTVCAGKPTSTMLGFM